MAALISRFCINAFGALSQNNFCTKIASRLTRTYTDRHGLKNLTSELLNVDLSKVQQSSDWAAEKLTKEQLSYAASDVLYLHDLRTELVKRLEREERIELADACFEFLPTRCLLDLADGMKSIYSPIPDPLKTQ